MNFPKVSHNTQKQRVQLLEYETKLKYELERLENGCYTFKELYNKINPHCNEIYFSKLLSKHCKTFNPILTKRGVNFYEKKNNLT